MAPLENSILEETRSTAYILLKTEEATIKIKRPHATARNSTYEYHKHYSK
jgi:hypothetical protein